VTDQARILVLHNRYRSVGGEERSVELQLRALRAAGVDPVLFERASGEVGRVRAARAMAGGGEQPRAVSRAVREHGATIAHAHNMHPLIGPRGLAAASAAGARVVLQLHNVRLFCATGFGERDNAPCTLCRGRRTLPGLRHNCRGSLPEAATYAFALATHQPTVLGAVDRFLTPSRWSAGRLVELGLPRERIETLPHYLPEEAFAKRSLAREGSYALVVSRLSPEKGIGDAIRAAQATGVPLRIAGDGSDRPRLELLAARSPADVQLLGRLSAEQVRHELRGAAVVLMPSRYHEFFPYSALEAIAQGVPVVATTMGGLPELLGPERCVALDDHDAFAARLGGLWADPDLRAAEGEVLIERARANHSVEPYLERLLGLYGRLGRD